ncbi:hypothetical protein V9T40_013718 [Parthenolecanium corni]|uniref:Scavenger receptor class B member 1 n=1 Tax=Parthenolecanium corni TaxID=536013 RepID=A0AAN9TDU4_9HEMI
MQQNITRRVRANGATTTYSGIPTVHYRFKEDALDNGEKNEDNKCFCSNGHCLRSGLIDVTHCYYGFPIALSYPHFYLADPSLREEIEGSNPDPNLHETYFHINPETGTPTNLSVKMQINIALGDVSSMLHCERFSNMVIPMLWTDITMPQLSKPIVIKLFLLLRVLPIVETVALYLFLIGGMAFVLLSICAVIFISTTKMPMQSAVKKPSSSTTTCSSAIVPTKSKHLKNEYHDSEKSLEGNKEMDMYYCSLLAPSNEREEA